MGFPPRGTHWIKTEAFLNERVIFILLITAYFHLLVDKVKRMLGKYSVPRKILRSKENMKRTGILQGVCNLTGFNVPRGFHLPKHTYPKAFQDNWNKFDQLSRWIESLEKLSFVVPKLCQDRRGKKEKRIAEGYQVKISRETTGK